MSLYNIIVLLFYGAGGVLALGNTRAAFWLALGALAYAGTVLYWNAALPFPEVVAGVVDFAIAGLVFIYADRKWEIPVFLAFQLCLLINFIYSLGMSEAYFHAVVLELVNIGIATFIGGVCAFERAGYGSAWALSPWRSIFGFARPFRAVDRKVE